jgi:hypothetical protein
MATKSMKVITERLMRDMQEAGFPLWCVNWVVKHLSSYADMVNVSPLSGRPRTKIVVLEELDKLRVGAFKEYPGYAINPQSVRSAATKANDLLKPKRFSCRAIGGNMRIYRAPDIKVPRGWVNPREAPLEAHKVKSKSYFDMEAHVAAIDAADEAERHQGQPMDNIAAELAKKAGLSKRPANAPMPPKDDD